MGTEMAVAYVDVLGVWAKFGWSGKFQNTGTVFKDFAVDKGCQQCDASCCGKAPTTVRVTPS